MKKKSKLRAFIKRHFALIVVIAIMTIPSIYTVLFLGSMWDPYGNTGSLPVAVVNQDVQVSYNGRDLDVGNQMCDNMRKNDSLQFNFVDERAAMDGLDNGTYYMVIVIPEDFSYNATTLTSDNPTKMELEYYTNPGNNYIASKISGSAANTIKATINESVINTYARTVFDSVVTAGNGFQQAADGSGELKGGLIQLKDGNNQIADGIGTLANGCLTLKDGTDSLKDGTVTLQNGTYSLKDGTITLKQGINDYTNGVDEVYNGTQQLKANNKALNSGSKQINDGLKEVSSTIGKSLPKESQEQLVTLEEGLVTLNDGIQTLNSSLNEGESGEKINSAIAELTNASAKLDEFVKSDAYQWLKQYNPNQYLDSYDNIVKQLETKNFWKLLPQSTKDAILKEIKKIYDDAGANGVDMSALKDLNLEGLSGKIDTVCVSLNSLTDGVRQLSAGGSQALPAASDTLKKLSSGLLDVKTALDMTQAENGSTGLIEGMTTLQSGIKTYTDGVSQVDDGVSQLAANSPKLRDGASQLYDGASQLAGGAVQLGDGASQLQNGAVRLSDGVNQLGGGDKQIKTGIGKLLIGADTLQTSLQAGADTVSSNNTDDRVTDMFASPVNATEHAVTNIHNNGEAMAAYMMCAALWIGCLAFCLMFSPYKSYLASKKGQRQFLHFSLISVFVAVIQAALMVTLLIVIDGMQPQHILLTFIMAILISLAFMSIVYFINTIMGSVGSFVLLVFLVLQLSGASGTYPIELSPGFYQIIHPLMPFSYGVSAFRSTISTGSDLTTPILVFLCIITVFTLCTAATFIVRSYRQKRHAKKELDSKFEEEMAYYNAEMQQ